MKILIVEDEAIPAMTVSIYLKKAGFEVCGIASSSVEAINMAKEHKPNIILMDTYLQDHISGIETVNKIKEFLNAKIVFCTGADKETIIEIEKTKPTTIIKKPVNLDKLIQIVKDIL